MNYYLGIDLGTSSTKTVLADRDGNVTGIGQVEYEVDTPRSGYAQQHPDMWWDAVKKAIRKVLADTGIASSEIAGIGMSGQMHGLVALDQDHNVLMPAPIHLDQRSVAERDELIRLGRDLLTTSLYNKPGTGMLISSLLWVKRHMPSEYEKIRYIMAPKDYIRYRLTGEIMTDTSDASAMLAFSVGSRTWCMDLVRRAGLKDDIWPTVKNAHDLGGTITSSAEQETGLKKGTPVAVGAGDICAALSGNGVFEKGTLVCNIGTASQLVVITDHPVTEETLTCQLWCHAADNRWIYQGGALNGGNTLGWFRNSVLGRSRTYEELDASAAMTPAGAEGLFFIPHLNGERPPFDSESRGAFYGLDLRHTSAHMTRAIMEGVLYNLKEFKKIFDAQGVDQTYLISCGGGARGSCWKQIQADMLNMPVHTTQTKEEACFGAILFAAVATGAYRNLQEAAKELVHVNADIVEPIQMNVDYYRQQQERYRSLYQHLAAWRKG